MKKTYSFVLICFLFISTASWSQNIKYSPNEKKCIQVFSDYINYIKDCIHNKTGIGDSVRLKYILTHYVFINSKLDTTDITHINMNELTGDQLNSLKTELNTFYRFLQERENKSLSENLFVMPLRLSDDKYIYSRLTAFQKENTFIFYDKREPGHPLGYMLFMAPLKNILAEPKIWSWTLMFKLGKYMFKSVTGEEGYEYIFSPEKFKRQPTDLRN